MPLDRDDLVERGELPVVQDRATSVTVVGMPPGSSESDGSGDVITPRPEAGTPSSVTEEVTVYSLPRSGHGSTCKDEDAPCQLTT